jgi:hypothetical protein
MARTMLRPGQKANADLHILTPDGRAAESVLGVLLFDRAVAERVRTGREYARPDPEMPCGHPQRRVRSQTVQAE